MANHARARGVHLLVAACLAASAPRHPAGADAGGHPGQSNAIAVRALIAAGRYAEAEVEARRPLQGSATSAPRQPSPAVDDVLIEALVRNGRGATPEARGLAEEIVRTKRAQHEATHPSLALSLKNLGDVLFEAGEYQAAADTFRETLAIYERLPHLPSSEVADALDQLVRALTEIEQFDDAQSLSARALALRSDAAPPSNLAIAQSLDVRGLLDSRIGNYPQAREQMERAVVLFEAEAPEHPTTAAALEHLGEQLAANGDLLRSREVSNGPSKSHNPASGPITRQSPRPCGARRPRSRSSASCHDPAR